MASSGATEFARLFKTGQIGRLYLVSSSHARGRTFHIYVLPEGEQAIPNGEPNGPLNKDTVEVFGITGGQPGWTETYGWLHNGKWQADFADLVKQREEELRDAADRESAAAEINRDARQEKVRRLLADY